MAANDSKGIAYHEMGHIINRTYGNNGLDIADEAYYNINGKYLSRLELFEYLETNVSEYAVYLPNQWKDKPFKKKHYKEVTPEILSMNKANPTAFLQEFVKLLKKRCSL